MLGADEDSAGGGPADGDGSGDGVDDGLEQRVAYLRTCPGMFRDITFLNLEEASDLYKRVESAAAAKNAKGKAGRGRGRRRGRGAGNAGGGAGAGKFPSFEEFLAALALIRCADEKLADFSLRAQSGTARAALVAALPALLEVRDMPPKIARRLVPLGYSMPATTRRPRGSGNLLDCV